MYTADKLLSETTAAGTDVMREDTNREAEVLKDKLDQGYTELRGLTVRSKYGDLEVTKLVDYEHKQPVTLTLSKGEIEKLYALVNFLDENNQGQNHTSKAKWAAVSINLADKEAGQ